MDACYHGDDLCTLTKINSHMPYIVTADQVVYMTIYYGMCLLIVRVQRSSPWQHASIHPGLVSLILYYPYIPSFKLFIYFALSSVVSYSVVSGSHTVSGGILIAIPTDGIQLGSGTLPQDKGML